MRQDQRSAIREAGVFLPAANTSDVGRDSRVDDDVFFSGVVLHAEAAEDEEAPAEMKVFRECPEDGAETREREGYFVDVSQGEFERYLLLRLNRLM